MTLLSVDQAEAMAAMSRHAGVVGRRLLDVDAFVVSVTQSSGIGPFIAASSGAVGGPGGSSADLGADPAQQQVFSLSSSTTTLVTLFIVSSGARRDLTEHPFDSPQMGPMPQMRVSVRAS